VRAFAARDGDGEETMRTHLLRSLALASGLAAVLAAPSSASATTEIGETFMADNLCGPMTPMDPPLTSLQRTSPNNQYAAPSSGVITAWSHWAGSSPPELKLKVARPAGVNSFTVIGESSFRVPQPNVLNTYPDVQIPVEAGDVIGFTVRANGNCGRSPGTSYGTSNLVGDPPPGATATFSPNPMFQLSVSATLEPDCDADGLGDETQDPSLLGGECPIRERTLTLSAGKKRVKKGTKVLFSGHLDEIANEPACESGQVVELQRKKPKGSTFTAFDHVTTFVSGDFATDVAVRRTYLYVAVVTESGGCGAQVSPIVKVKVKKKKRKKGKKK
jgi:hypothetical protein